MSKKIVVKKISNGTLEFDINAEVDLNPCLPAAAVELDGIAVDYISLASQCSIAPKCAIGNREIHLIAVYLISALGSVQRWPPVNAPMHCNGVAHSYHNQPINARKWAPPLLRYP